MIDPEALLRRMFDAALAAADPKLCLPPFLAPLAAASCAGRTGNRTELTCCLRAYRVARRSRGRGA